MQEWAVHALWLASGAGISALGALLYRRHEIRKYAKRNQTPIPNNGTLLRISELDGILTEKESALLKADAKFRALFDHAPVLINSFTADGSVDLWNKECERVLGYTRSELETVSNVMTLFYKPKEVPYVWKDIRKAAGQFKEYAVRSKSGRRIRMAWANMPLPDGTTIGVGYVLKKVRKSSTAPLATRTSRPTKKKPGRTKNADG